MIDVTMTSVLRPMVLQDTLESFYENLFKGHERRIILNIDSVGDLSVPPYAIVRLAERYCVNLTWRAPSSPNFSKAVLWTWGQVETPFFWNIEDDWRLLAPVSMDAMLDKMMAIPDLGILRLPMFPSSEHTMKNWNKIFYFNTDGFFECPPDIRHRVGFCGHPSLIRKEWLDRILPLLDDYRNVEKQIQLCRVGSALYLELMEWRYGVWSEPGSGPYIKDLGRDWIAKSGWKKSGPKAWFVEWERSDAP